MCFSRRENRPPGPHLTCQAFNYKYFYFAPIFSNASLDERDTSQNFESEIRMCSNVKDNTVKNLLKK